MCVARRLRLGTVAVASVPEVHTDCDVISYSTTDLGNRETNLLKLALIINMDVKDNHEEAAIGGKLALDFCLRVRTFLLRRVVEGT